MWLTERPKKWLNTIIDKYAVQTIVAGLTVVGGSLVGFVEPVRAFLLKPLQLPTFAVLALSLTVVSLSGYLWYIKRPTKDWREFRQHEFDGIVWRWRWSSDNTIDNLMPLCPKCRYDIEPLEVGSADREFDFYCTLCDNRWVAKRADHIFPGLDTHYAVYQMGLKDRIYHLAQQEYGFDLTEKGVSE